MIRRKYKYDVSFSFAEENNAFVQEVASHLKQRNFNYYYYKEDLVLSWGKDLEEYLAPIYKRHSRLCVVFVSAAYRDKVWTKFELTTAKVRARNDIQEYILPFKLDDTELPEIAATTIHLSRNDFDAEGLADAIFRKIDVHRKQDRFFLWLYGKARYYRKSPRHLIGLGGFIALSVIGWFALRDHLTPVNTLTPRLYKENMRHFRSLCRDGTLSKSTRQGTCSHHGGVAMPIDTFVEGKTMAECRAKAKEISWIGE